MPEVRPYNPFDHYWIADDGRVFASARTAAVKQSDAAFGAWQEAGGIPTVWPRDDAGAQTDAALKAVLNPYGIWLDAPPTQKVITFKADIFRRCTDDEADKIDAALTQAPTRQRRLFETAQFLDHSAEEFTVLADAVVGLFGDERASVLLAPSE